ncbi:Bifunctional purine biosynthesis protein PurH [Galdieria sulphuraria]|uniref:Bifunctional phosphoribosylaminoimidazolecarboxamide formyltransferase / IMP cyclohydrolase n=1 Tax=Galdieria sulphuraria TaxID=130081 RepID=M2X1Z0_GALSU|nr:bifunctional phosphoribosylaminoimidazolecarboxamide formyltransferase / IMP cyclohydrolase [Galdieria sulphuraria]EME30355.1 bifunctional phosphoribosylaminoimidazolecarboxamide formyltransferase / IMP cyclohydrolase [Galdieria sulphuraria]GJD12982.1 Bifunctional purine biosynthesis protein PurH [Galdieria sulphuraria]|eukprot:XP_005706875.1 bifunctional phosphoribosylaminoimidazolecarboxamide formyltransferase / IMP cyclohydrolase [Galdieria sulphuraria]
MLQHASPTALPLSFIGNFIYFSNSLTGSTKISRRIPIGTKVRCFNVRSNRNPLLMTGVQERTTSKESDYALVKIKRALISVSDKSCLIDVGKALEDLGVEILSTGGSARKLRENGLKVTDISDFSGFPEILGGRVKTLHPAIHGGILMRRDVATDEEEAKTHQIHEIDLVIANLYPFEEACMESDLSHCIEQIDIGGTVLIRAAAKNHRWVTVVSEISQYPELLSELSEFDGCTRLDFRKKLAARAFARCASYDAVIAERFFQETHENELPPVLTVTAMLQQELRYGENPHQKAAFYVKQCQKRPLPGVASAEQIQGKELSYNNIADTDAAFQLVCEFEEPAVAIIKHSNPCGAAVGVSAEDAYLKALSCDSLSAFGGIVACNRTIDLAAAEAITKIFTEVLIAPDATTEALSVLSCKKNLRVLLTGSLMDMRESMPTFRSVNGGILYQTSDNGHIGKDDLQVVTKRVPTQTELEDLLFAWRICKHIKSNAIVLAKNKATVGVGAGQMSRVDASHIAIWKATEAAKATDEAHSRAVGSVLASDAFFPFEDGLVIACEAGVQAVIQPGGSKRDEEVIAAADRYGISMVFTGMRHFRH